MPANYVLLEKITVGAAGASSVTFSGIPQTGYTDLVLKASCRSDQSNVARSWKVQPNGVDITARNLDAEGNPFVAFSGTSINMNTNGTGSTSNTFNNYDVYIPNYASTTTYKSISVDGVVENNGTDANVKLVSGLYSANTAISSITCIINAGLFVQYSTFYLYGVAKLGTTPAISPYATGGDTIMTDGTYWYHTFISSGTFTPAKALSCDYLVVAGGAGGGGGSNFEGSGGGGAGGFRSTVTATGGGGSLETALLASAGINYTVTVGAGGAAGFSTAKGSDGSNSVFSTVTSTGGGGGAGTVANKDGNTGGAGGGGSENGGTGGAGTTNQGFAGGNSTNNTHGAGGGGAGAAGAAAPTAGLGSAGGNGVATSISGSSVTYAGGGGGGSFTGNPAASGGSGGGGVGGVSGTGAGAGTTNTGSGGGGACAVSGNFTGGAGGSGIVIVRYAV